MVSAIMLGVSLAALAHFAFYYWRAVVRDVASAELSGRISTDSGAPGAGDFFAVLALYKMCPELSRRGRRIGLVKAYFRLSAIAARLLEPVLPSVARWAKDEMAICTRYVAVLADQRVDRNLAYAATIHAR